MRCLAADLCQVKIKSSTPPVDNNNWSSLSPRFHSLDPTSSSLSTFISPTAVSRCCGLSDTNKHLQHKHLTTKEKVNRLMVDLCGSPSTHNRNINFAQLCSCFYFSCRLLRERRILRWACWRTWGGNVSLFLKLSGRFSALLASFWWI